jgi:hypothetical protein
MIDITQQIQLYRETVRHIWNSCFASEAGRSPAGEVFEAFDTICEQLFVALILSPNAISEPVGQLNVQGFPSIRVIPLLAEGTPILINRTEPTGPYWDDPVNVVKPDEIELGFMGFFDWDSYGIIDMRYVRARVLACHSNRALEGREALVEMGHAKVVTLPGGRSRLPAAVS